MSEIHVRAFDHLVLNVADVERSLAFYVGTLGLEPVRVDRWRSGEVFFPSVRVDPGTILDLLATPRSGVNTDHFCLVVDPIEPGVLEAAGITIEDGPDRRFGARGEATSVYIRDPDGNLVELRWYD